MSGRRFISLLVGYYLCGVLAYGTMYAAARVSGSSNVEAGQAGIVVAVIGPLGLALSIPQSGFWEHGWRLR